MNCQLNLQVDCFVSDSNEWINDVFFHFWIKFKTIFPNRSFNSIQFDIIWYNLIRILPFVNSFDPEKSVNIISGILVGVLGVCGPCWFCEFWTICWWCELEPCCVCGDWCCGDVGECNGCCICAWFDWLTWFVVSLAIVVEFKLIFGFERPIDDDICIWFDCIVSSPDGMKLPSSY